MFSCRTFPFETGDGPANMGLDAALLDAVAEGGPALLRAYGWSEPTLSLGYFQPAAVADRDGQWQGVPVVRRPTGGGALWHDLEVTYCLVLPASHPLSSRPRDLYRAVHDAIAGLVVGSGLDAGRRGEAESSEAAKPFLCFLDRDPEDVVSGAVKVVGSAQRRRAGAVLQHGSLLLRRSPRTPDLPGLADLGAEAEDAATWACRLLDAIPKALGAEAIEGAIPDEVRHRAGALAEGVYRNPSWTRRR